MDAESMGVPEVWMAMVLEAAKVYELTVEVLQKVGRRQLAFRRFPSSWGICALPYVVDTRRPGQATGDPPIAGRKDGNYTGLGVE